MNKKILYPKISIVTPNLNQGAFLEETIESVLSQRYPNIEYIIMDGGSTDNSLSIIKKYEKHLTFWTSQKDKGQYFAICSGFDRATGEILAWINSGDGYCPGAFIDVAKAFQNKQEIMMVYGDGMRINEDGSFNHIFRPGTKWAKQYLFYTTWLIGQETTFYSMRAYNKVGGLNTNWEYAADYDLIARIAAIGKIKYIPQVLAFGRLCTGNAQRHRHLRNGINIYSGEHREIAKLLGSERGEAELTLKIRSIFWTLIERIQRKGFSLPSRSGIESHKRRIFQ